MLERTKVVMSREEYNRLRVKNPELPPLENEELSVKPAKEDYRKVEATWLSEDEVWGKRTHDIPNWALTLLITLSVVGASFTAWEIYLHQILTAVIAGFIGITLLVAKICKDHNEED
jgi:hypothetical protein